MTFSCLHARTRCIKGFSYSTVMLTPYASSANSEEMGLQFSKPVNIENVDENDIIIAVVGQTGVGKSTFINSAVRQQILPIGRSLKPETREIQHVEARNGEGRRFIFVEAPGFDSEKEDKIEKKLRTWLKKVSSKQLRISGILYLHRITDDRLSSPPKLHLSLMKALCEESANGFPNRTVLVTTMWGILKTKELAESREKELQAYWANLPWAKESAVSKVMRFDGTSEGAELIISALMEGRSAFEVRQVQASGTA